MNLQSENIGPGISSQQMTAGFPARFVHSQLPHREVARLDFLAVGADGTGATEAEEAFVVEAEPPLNVDTGAQSPALSQEEIDALIDATARRVRSESREAWETETAARVAAERRAVMETCERFSAERARYFECVESEVVKLSLAVAARILNREARMDPLLLSAAVRLALEKIADGSSATLRVPASDETSWREAFRDTAEKGVELIGDNELEPGECVLEANAGRVDLGVNAQLTEIEQGFFDLLQRRPA